MAGETRRAKEESPKDRARLVIHTEARGVISEREVQKPKSPRPKAPKNPEAQKRKEKPQEEEAPLPVLVAREIAEDNEEAPRVSWRSTAEKGSAPSQAPQETTSSPRRKSAEALAQKQRDISVSEFFAKNRHLLGFDNPAKSLLTAIKEAVDNSLDACEEAGILPTISVSIEEISQDRFRVAVEDNGPGIVKQQIPKIFGKLLYGSKFHTMRQSRGQQGIGISAAGMYGQLTTGKPVAITSRPGPDAPATYCELQIDTRTNKPQVLHERKNVEWRPGSGTRVEIELSGLYKKGRHSVDAYLQQTAIANPHAEISYLAPRSSEWVIWRRQANTLPKEPVEIKPHPHGIELGLLMQMLQETPCKTLKEALCEDFSRVSATVADEICQKAEIPPDARPQKVAAHEVESLYKAIQETKIMAPPTNCLSPIGADLIQRGLESGVPGAEFYAATTRPPAVYRGIPFQIEVGIAYGGALSKSASADAPCDLYRFANRVPLLYQQSACGISKAVMNAGWRNYGLSQPKGGLPIGPLVLVVHIASVWVPFTSESKEAIAHYPEILREMRLAIQDCGRKLGSHIRKQKRFSAESKKRSYIDKYLPYIGGALKEILGLDDEQKKELVETLHQTMEKSRRQMLPASMRKAEDAEQQREAQKELPFPQEEEESEGEELTGLAQVGGE